MQTLRVVGLSWLCEAIYFVFFITELYLDTYTFSMVACNTAGVRRWGVPCAAIISRPFHFPNC